ncbi:MAG: hypothetical protein ACOVP1_03915 [Bacteroidia bacterium]
MKQFLLLASISIVCISCQSLQPKFGKICIKLEKEKLNYTINSDFPDSFFSQRSIDYFDWYFLHYFDQQILEKGYQTDSRGCAVWYEIQSPGFDIYGLKNKTLTTPQNKSFQLNYLYADFGAKLTADKTFFFQVNDSLPESITYLDYKKDEVLPSYLWIKEKKVKRSENYAYLPEGFNDHDLQNLAFRMAQKIAAKTDSIISQELKSNQNLIQKVYYPGNLKK